MGIRRLIPALAVAVTATSCSLDVPTDVGNIAIYLEVDKATLPLEESVTITARARNVGYDTITLTGKSDCLVFIQVLNSAGLIVYNAEQTCTGQTVTRNPRRERTRWRPSSGTGATRRDRGCRPACTPSVPSPR